MSESTNTASSKYEAVAYNELRKLAAERGLPSNGTKEELVARLVEADGAGAPKNEGEGGNTNSDEQKPPAPPAPRPSAPKDAVRPASSSDVDRAYRSSATQMKDHLAKQLKVAVFIPFEAGENPEQAAKVPFIVNLNGWQTTIPRGTYVEVPRQVADIVRERLESEGKAGRSHRVDADAKRQEALS